MCCFSQYISFQLYQLEIYLFYIHRQKNKCICFNIEFRSIREKCKVKSGIRSFVIFNKITDFSVTTIMSFTVTYNYSNGKRYVYNCETYVFRKQLRQKHVCPLCIYNLRSFGSVQSTILSHMYLCIINQSLFRQFSPRTR